MYGWAGEFGLVWFIEFGGFRSYHQNREVVEKRKDSSEIKTSFVFKLTFFYRDFWEILHSYRRKLSLPLVYYYRCSITLFYLNNNNSAIQLLIPYCVDCTLAHQWRGKSYTWCSSTGDIISDNICLVKPDVVGKLTNIAPASSRCLHATLHWQIRWMEQTSPTNKI